MAGRDNRAAVDVLVVEDNPGDVRLVQEALGQAAIRTRLHVVRDGDEALAFLRRRPPHDTAPPPSLILMDLNLPGKDGRATLAEIKNDEALKHIPVIVLTTSRSEEDVLRAYRSHANCFVAKPLKLEHFVQVIQSIHEFWLTTVTLPVA